MNRPCAGARPPDPGRSPCPAGSEEARAFLTEQSGPPASPHPGHPVRWAWISCRDPHREGLALITRPELGACTSHPTYPPPWPDDGSACADPCRPASENYPLAWLAVRLRGSSLAKASLFKADLRGADLRETDLRQAVLREATADLTTW
ncbi:MAG TPA: hypothetical protein DEH11_20840 [Actinobacteria bacterium]|nr:hypothetical protein [Actinomycetota bacterium]